MHNYKELKVWQFARNLVKVTYQITKRFPDEERYGLVSQVRRSAISICCNIAEGSGRNTEKEFLNYLKISRGSSFETECLYILSNDLEFLSDDDFEKLEPKIIEIQKMLHGLINSKERSKS